MRSTLQMAMLLVLASAYWGCPARRDSAPQGDAGAGGDDSGVDLLDAGSEALEPADASIPSSSSPSRARGIDVELTVEAVDGGRTTLTLNGLGLDAGASEIEPARLLELRLSPRPQSPRIRLFDWTEQIVESNDTDRSSGDDPIYAYRIEALEPLRAGRTYTLTVDSELGGRLLDASGSPLEEVRMPLKVVGGLKADSPSRSGPSRRRRHR